MLTIYASTLSKLFQSPLPSFLLRLFIIAQSSCIDTLTFGSSELQSGRTETWRMAQLRTATITIAFRVTGCCTTQQVSIVEMGGQLSCQVRRRWLCSQSGNGRTTLRVVVQRMTTERGGDLRSVQATAAVDRMPMRTRQRRTS